MGIDAVNTMTVPRAAAVQPTKHLLVRTAIAFTWGDLWIPKS